MAETKKRVEKLYNGEVTIIFYPDSHRYKLEDEKTYLVSATGATGILDKSQALIPWACNLMGEYILGYIENTDHLDRDELTKIVGEGKKQHTVKKEEAGNIGNAVHEWIELFVASKMNNTKPPDEPEDEKVANGVNAFLDWYLSNDVVFHASERLLYSRKHQYVGLTDFIATINGKRVVGDWKTSKRVYDEHRLQLSGYWGAIEEEEGVALDGGLILHCDKETGEFGIVEISKEEHLLHYPVFISCLHVKEWKKKMDKINNNY